MSDAPDDAAGVPDALRAVLTTQLGEPPSWTRSPRWTRDGIRWLVALAGGARRRDVVTEVDTLGLVRLTGVEPAHPERVVREIGSLFAEGAAIGIPAEAIPTVVQAYARAVGRVAAAEADLIRSILAPLAPAQRPDHLRRLLRTLLPITVRGFELLHQALLEDALVTALDGELLAGPEVELTVGLVDVVGSTAHLLADGPSQLESLVDALFEAGQSATLGRAVSPVKYVGDGVFLLGRDTAEVAEAALDAVARLERLLPLPAHGGIARGSVLRRAGDVFGIPVNTAQLLTKAARPGELLADTAAAAALPPALRRRARRATLHHALREVRVTPVRAAA